MRLSDDQRQVLIEILEQLIPANKQRGIPGGGQARTDRYLLSAADKSEPLARSLRCVLGYASGKDISTHLIQAIESELPEDFSLLLSETYKGYYSQPHIRGSLGLSDQPVHPAGYTVQPETPEFLSELTAPVTDRGPCYRDTKNDVES